jgi:penicillin-binding protein 1A
MALGTVAVSPLELTAPAYTAFANLGDGVKPRVIVQVERPDGEVVWESKVERRRVLEPQIAFLLNDALRDALQRGTGQAVRQAGFDGPAAGKTGTTNDGADAWFVGYNPEVVATVWIGFDRPQTIMARATGGRLAAPVWARIMRRLYHGRPMPRLWAPPGGIVEAWVDPATGLPLAPGCQPLSDAPYREIFIASMAPTPTCPTRGEPPPLEETLDVEAETDEEIVEAPVESEPTRVTPTPPPEVEAEQDEAEPPPSPEREPPPEKPAEPEAPAVPPPPPPPPPS